MPYNYLQNKSGLYMYKRPQRDIFTDYFTERKLSNLSNGFKLMMR